MNKLKVLIEDATVEQLIQFSQDSMGLPKPPANISKATMIGKLRTAGWTHDDIEITVEHVPDQTGEPPAGIVTPVPRKLSGTDDPKVKIVLNKHERPGGDRPEPVAVNGVAMLIPRGEPVTIPYRYFEVLKNAVEVVRVEDQNTGEVSQRHIPAFQFSVLSMPDERAIAAYLDRNDPGRARRAAAAAAADDEAMAA